MQQVLGFLAAHVFGLGTGTVISAGVAYVVNKFGLPWLANLKSDHAKNAVVLAASMAREICLFMHDANIFQGNTIMPKLEEAANQLVTSMAGAGYTITLDNARNHVQTAHTDLSLRTDTRYNEAPTMTVFGAKVIPTS